jgi:hypothetical protein
LAHLRHIRDAIYAVRALSHPVRLHRQGTPGICAPSPLAVFATGLMTIPRFLPISAAGTARSTSNAEGGACTISFVSYSENL